MKLILGLDLGPASIGWSVVSESDDFSEESIIHQSGVRVVPLMDKEGSDFSKGKSITTGADRRACRGARRNNQRKKLNLKHLKEILLKQGFITENTIFAENGPNSTYATINLRAKAATEKVTLEELSIVLMALCRKRGYKSNRKTKVASDGTAFDGIDVAKELQQRKITPAQYVLERFNAGEKVVPQFYKSDLLNELKSILSEQKKYYPEINDNLIDEISKKNESQTWSILSTRLNIKGVKRSTGKGIERKKEEYNWRVTALSSKVDAEVLAEIVAKINGAISASSGLLNQISERSKELILNGETIGQYKARILADNPHYRFKDKGFYRQDYIAEFDVIWNTQARFHTELTDELKEIIKNKIIFYQRPLKSQKDKVAYCELATGTFEREIGGVTRTIVSKPKVAPKSSPLFQLFRIWQKVNDLRVDNQPLTLEQKQLLARNLEYTDKMTDKEIAKLLFPGAKNVKFNIKEIEGNCTIAYILKSCEEAIYGIDARDERTPAQRADDVASSLRRLNIDPGFLTFDPTLKDMDFQMQPAYRLWHLLYSAEDDDSRTGDEKLKKCLARTFNLTPDLVKTFANITFQPDYGSLSVKAIKKLLPFMMEGLMYSEACEAAGYNHSKRSRTKEQIANQVYKTHLEQLKHNSLRSPVVEKMLNQMINLLNSLIDRFGPFDEIRVELARELKKSAKEREKMSNGIAEQTQKNNEIINDLREKFNIHNPSKSDIIKYRLYEELESTGYHTLYSNTYIEPNQLFTKQFEIEHILPKALYFDDSFANKTLETSAVNKAKDKMTAMDYMETTYNAARVEDYLNKINDLERSKTISKQKAKYLRCRRINIPDGFLNRDLSLTQYITKKTVEILEEVTPVVTVTTGSITAFLRQEWNLVELMKELNWDKYNALGLTETHKNRHGNIIHTINKWSKRDDNRHHAVDAITIAFTRPEYINYLNHLNAKDVETSPIYSLKKKILVRDAKSEWHIKPPMPLCRFRAEVKACLESMLISLKSKNPVVSKHIATTKPNAMPKCFLTPRGSLHNATFYGKNLEYSVDEVAVNKNLDEITINKVVYRPYRDAIAKRFASFGGDPVKAFSGKNSTSKNPIFIDETLTEKVPDKVKIVELKEYYTKRTGLSETLDIDSIIDKGVARIIQQRIDRFDGNKKQAFANLDTDPIYLNKEKGIVIKKVKIKANIKDAIALHDKTDHLGNTFSDSEGHKISKDYVQPYNNHHALFFITPSGKVENKVVSLLEAVTRAIAEPPMPVIDRNYNADEGWKFLMSLKKNELVVFPGYTTDQEGDRIKIFDPKEIDLLNQDNYKLISPYLFRVQIITDKDYTFRHHLDTSKDKEKSTQGVTWKRITKIDLLKDVVKVRLDNMGKIVHVGE